MATIDNIIAMKMEVIQGSGRKKDFWDIHELMDDYTFEEMLALNKQRYLYTHDRDLLINQLTNFEEADSDFELDCLRGRHWELVKLNLVEFR